MLSCTVPGSPFPSLLQGRLAISTCILKRATVASGFGGSQDKSRCLPFTRLFGGYRHVLSCSCPSTAQNHPRMAGSKQSVKAKPISRLDEWFTPSQAREARQKRDLISAGMVSETQSLQKGSLIIA